MKTRTAKFSALALILSAALMLSCCASKPAAELTDDIQPETFFSEEIIYADDDDAEEVFSCDANCAEEENDILPELPEEKNIEITPPADADSGRTLTILCRDGDFSDALKTINTEECLPEGIRLNIIEDDYSYTYGDINSLEYLSGLLEKHGGTEPVDIFLTEPELGMYSHINSSLTLPLSEAGITENDTADMFPYTVALGTSQDGALKALTFRADPGVFVYRRDIALEVFGDDSPETVAGLLAEDYINTAEKLKEKGYFITSAAEETYRGYSQNRTEPLTDGNGNIVIGRAEKQWLDDMRRDIESGFNPNCYTWTEEWFNGMTSADSDIFGYYLPQWGCDFLVCLNWIDGDGFWGICIPPRPYCWGGTFLCVSAQTDNRTACGAFLKAMCCSPAASEKYTLEYGNFCNSMSAIKRLASDERGYSSFFSQNVYDIYYQAAMNVPVRRLGKYDAVCEEKFPLYMRDCFSGASYETCLEMFMLQSGGLE